MKHLLAVLAIASACSEPAAPPELATWIEDWEKTRTCLLGGRDGDLEALETALALGELEGVSCPVPPALKVVGVDAALAERWQRASDRAVVVARAGDPAERARLVTVIDADVAELRERAGLPPRVEAGAPRVLPALPAGRTIEVAGRALRTGELGHADAGVLHGVALRPGERVVFAASPTLQTEVRYPEQATVGLPSGSWYVYPQNTRLRISDRPAVRLDGRNVRAAIDHGRFRVLVLGGPKVSLAVSADDGETWRTIDYTTPLVALDQDPRTGAIQFVLRYRSPRDPESWSHLWAVRLGPEDLERLVTLDWWPQMAYVIRSETTHETPVVPSCRAGDTSWMASAKHLYRLREREVARMELSKGAFATLVQVACDREVAVLLRRDPAIVERCIAGGCAPVLELEHARRGAVAIDEHGRWLYAAAAGRIVGIWREGGKPMFYRLPETGEVHALPLFGRTRQLVLSTDDGYRFIALPAEVTRG